MEYFINYVTAPAPFFPDSGTTYERAASPNAALGSFTKGWDGIVGLELVEVYATADSFHKKNEPLATWMSAKVMQASGVKGGVVQ